jgi:hypothetical protein
MQKTKHFFKRNLTKFKNSLFYNSIKSINLKNIYSSLSDGAFFLLFFLWSMLISVILELMFGSANINSIASEELIASIYISLLSKALIFIVIFILVSILIYSASRFLIYSFLYKKWHGWKIFWKYSLFNLIFFSSLILLMLFGDSIFKEHIIGYYGLILFMLYGYFILSFNIVYFNKPDFLISLKKCFFMGFGFLGRTLLGIFTIIIASLLLTLFINLLHLLNVTKNIVTTNIITSLNIFLVIALFLIAMSWLRTYLIEYYLRK